MRRTTTLLAACGALALGITTLSGCTSGNDGPGHVTVETEAAIPQHVKTHAPQHSGDTGGNAGTGNTGTADDAAACLVGSWVIERDSVAEAARVSMAALGPDVGEPEVTVEGEAVLTLTADGTMRTEYRQQSADVTIDVSGSTVRSVSTMGGFVVGRYDVTADRLTMSDLDSSGVTLTTVATINGAPYDSSATDSMTVAALELGGTSTFTCAGDELRVTPTAPGLGSSLVTVYHRA